MLSHMVYDWCGANVALFRLINGIHASGWDYFMVMGTRLADPLPFAVLAAVAAGAALLIRRRDALEPAELAISLALAYVLVSAIVWILKISTDLPRPAEVLGGNAVRILLPPDDAYSFPSGHAARAALLIASLWPWLSIRMRIAGVFLVLWVGLSRVAAGAHFPVDVAAGIAVGLLGALAIRRIVVPLARRAVQQRN